MKIITTAKLSWTEHQEPYAEQFDDCYFSATNGLAETQHVFLDGNHLRERWQTLTADDFVIGDFVIGETGFGTGLNFIAAWKLWNEVKPGQSHLTFVSAELHPLHKKDLIKAAARWPELKSFYDQLLEHYPVLTAGFHTLRFDQVTLLLLLGDATVMFNEMLATDHPDFNRHHGRKFDAWFLDGFSPAKNPALWTDALTNTIALLSKTGTTLATFSAAGDMRRNLESMGFEVQKQKGFANKREMVTAIFQMPAEQRAATSMMNKPVFVSSPYMTPWYIDKKDSATTSKQVAVIGAGIAGCTIAHALARKGFYVTIIDEQAMPASQSSGNLQAMLYSKFSSTDDEFAQFNLASYLYALRFYQQLLKQYPALDIHFCGALQLTWSANEQAPQNTLRDFFTHYPDIAHFVTREQASVLAGLPVESGGLFFSQAGWINPAKICEQLLQHPHITTLFNQHITSLHHEKNQWQIICNTQALNSSDHVVIANGHQCQQFEQAQFLRLKFIRGQVSHAMPTPVSRQLKTVLCSDGYIAPATGNIQSFGATYTPNKMDFNLTDTDHETNLKNLQKSSQLLSEQWNINNNANKNINKGIIGGRTHIRTASPDYFPVCGLLPKEDDFLSTYAPLRKNANANILETGSYQPNLYICTGLGSRGMTYAPLCAEIITDLITQGPLSLPRTIVQNLNPARFIIRDLIKNRL